MRYRHRVFIDSPVSRVFSYMDDVEKEREWQPGIKKASKDPEGPTAVGTRKRYVSEFLGRPIANTYTTTVFEPDRRVVYETTAESVLRAKVELTFEAVDSGTRVTMEVQAKPTGFLRFIPQAILETTAKKELEGSMALLKKRLEATG